MKIYSKKGNAFKTLNVKLHGPGNKFLIFSMIIEIKYYDC